MANEDTLTAATGSDLAGPGAAPLDAAGHRARLRERLFADPDGLLDHELVEYLLALAIPRRDVKPIAKRLLRQFDGLPALFAAEPAALAAVDGMGEVSAAAIKIVRAVALRLLRAETMAQPVLANWQALIDYLHVDLAPDTIERVRVLHLNGRNMLIRDETLSTGTIDQAPVYVREVVKRAMNLGSAAIILVHNHPSGDPSPSQGDIDLTRALIDATRRLGIAVHDHVIIGRRGHVSLKTLGLI